MLNLLETDWAVNHSKRVAIFIHDISHVFWSEKLMAQVRIVFKDGLIQHLSNNWSIFMEQSNTSYSYKLPCFFFFFVQENRPLIPSNWSQSFLPSLCYVARQGTESFVQGRDYHFSYFRKLCHRNDLSVLWSTSNRKSGLKSWTNRRKKLSYEK